VVSVLRNALVSETNSSLELYGITVFGRGFAETRNLNVLVAGHRTGAEPDFCRAMGPMVTRDSVLPGSAPTAAPMRFKRVRLVRGGSERESSRRSGATPCATERPLARRPRLGRRSRSHSIVCGSRSEPVDAASADPERSQRGPDDEPMLDRFPGSDRTSMWVRRRPVDGKTIERFVGPSRDLGTGLRRRRDGD
jgi:hypothetical protein